MTSDSIGPSASCLVSPCCYFMMPSIKSAWTSIPGTSSLNSARYSWTLFPRQAPSGWFFFVKYSITLNLEVADVILPSLFFILKYGRRSSEMSPAIWYCFKKKWHVEILKPLCLETSLKLLIGGFDVSIEPNLSMTIFYLFAAVSFPYLLFCYFNFFRDS